MTNSSCSPVTEGHHSSTSPFKALISHSAHWLDIDWLRFILKCYQKLTYLSLEFSSDYFAVTYHLSSVWSFAFIFGFVLERLSCWLNLDADKLDDWKLNVAVTSYCRVFQVYRRAFSSQKLSFLLLFHCRRRSRWFLGCCASILCVCVVLEWFHEDFTGRSFFLNWQMDSWFV